MSKSIMIRGALYSFAQPVVMGILNVTPDSFFQGSRCQTEHAILDRASQILEEGGGIIDLGAYSSRPQAEHISLEEEFARLSSALTLIRKAYPEAILSVDTFRAEVARRCVQDYGVDIINDISGGGLDAAMFDTIAALQVPYIMMHMRGTPQTMMQDLHYQALVPELLTYFAQRMEQLNLRGVNDVMIDPGFGFSKSLQQNYQLLRQLSAFEMLEAPLLVGVSRKSMIYKLLDTTPEQSLNGTSVLHALALQQGASILRVHDVREARECVQLLEQFKQSTTY